ncbi:MAG TPA: substrate-binding domain-containing protein [Armatimonadota bacterium]|jgi:ribose transport system substrate-binding protein
MNLCKRTMFLAASAALLLAGCSPKSPAPPASGPTSPTSSTKKIGITLLARTDPFYQQMEAAMTEEAKAKGFELDVQDARKDLNVQMPQMETFISQGKDAIVVCPVNSEGIGKAITKANAANIPVFTADIKADKGAVVSHIASDNVEGGRLAGERLGKLLGGRGKVVILDYPVVASVRQRDEGFLKGIAKYPDIQVVERPSCRGDRNESLNQMETMMQKYPDLAGAFCINDNTALGALKAVQSHTNSNVVLVGYDGDPEARRAIAAGTALKADAVQFPRAIGKQTIDAIADYFAGKKPPAFVPVKVGLIDKDSAGR